MIPEVVDHYMFALVDHFDTLEISLWEKYPFELTLSSLKEGLAKEVSHYRLTGFLIAFQMSLYECMLGLQGNITTGVCKKYLRIMNWSVHEHPSVALLE